MGEAAAIVLSSEERQTLESSLRLRRQQRLVQPARVILAAALRGQRRSGGVSGCGPGR